MPFRDSHLPCLAADIQAQLLASPSVLLFSARFQLSYTTWNLLCVQGTLLHPKVLTLPLQTGSVPLHFPAEQVKARFPFTKKPRAQLKLTTVPGVRLVVDIAPLAGTDNGLHAATEGRLNRTRERITSSQ